MIGPPRKSTLFPTPPLSHSAVEKVNDHADDKPDDEPFPCSPRESNHQVKRRQCPQRGHDPHRRCFKGSWQMRLANTQHEDRKSTRLNSSHSQISYAVFCLKK